MLSIPQEEVHSVILLSLNKFHEISRNFEFFTDNNDKVIIEDFDEKRQEQPFEGVGGARYDKHVFQIMLDNMEEKDQFRLEESSDKLYVCCLPCSTKKKKLIEAGPKAKSLSNLKAHVKTSKHISN